MADVDALTRGAALVASFPHIGGDGFHVLAFTVFVKSEARFTVEERLKLLSDLDNRVPALAENILAATLRKNIAADDILDACCLAIMPLAGRFQTLPENPEKDDEGLKMEICFYGA